MAAHGRHQPRNAIHDRTVQVLNRGGKLVEGEQIRMGHGLIVPGCAPAIALNPRHGTPAPVFGLGQGLVIRRIHRIVLARTGLHPHPGGRQFDCQMIGLEPA